MSVSEVRKILDEIAVEVGIQKIDEQDLGVDHHVFYYMLGSESYFMNFRWHNNGGWRINVADRIKYDSKIITTGNTTIYPSGFDAYAIKMIKERLKELITNFNKALKELKITDIKKAGAEYVVG